MRQLGLKDVFTLTAIIEKLGLRSEITEIVTASEGLKDQMTYVGTQMFSILVSKLNLIEEEVYGWLADITGKTTDDVSLLNFSELKEIVTILINDDGLKELFTSLASKEKN